MIYDIFKSKTNKQQEKELIKLKIIADIHEKNSLVIANLIEQKVDVEIQSLEIGDYISGDIVIERKTASDFISSMINRRLFEQLKNLNQYENRILLVEGYLNETQFKINENAILGMLATISLDYKIPIMFTKDSGETAKFLMVLAKRKLNKKSELSLHSRKPKNTREKIQYILESFEGIGPTSAKKLLEKFKTLKNIFNLDKNELEKEIGKKSDAFSVLDEEY